MIIPDLKKSTAVIIMKRVSAHTLILHVLTQVTWCKVKTFIAYIGGHGLITKLGAQGLSRLRDTLTHVCL